MRPCVSIRTAALLVILFLNSSLGQNLEKNPEQKPVEWLRGSGKELQLCIQGEIVDADGKAATDARVTALIDGQNFQMPAEVKMEGHHFKTWVPLNGHDLLNWFHVRIAASSIKGDRVAYHSIFNNRLRQSAIDGVKLTLQQPTRHLEVKVVENSQPVSNATVEANFALNAKLRSRTDAQGIARFDVMPDHKLSELSAWTEDRRIGGYYFDRKPTHDPDAKEHTIELTKCRDLKIRLVDETGSPIPDVDFVIGVSTGEPNYNGIAANENSRLKSDSNGEAVYRFLPNWNKLYFDVDVRSKHWILNGELKKDNDSVTYKLKKAQQRIQVSGRVATDLTSPGGFFVEVRSFQGEQEGNSDQIHTFTDPDGTFTVDVLPDAKYCAFINDSRWVSNMIDLVPYNSATNTVNPINLSIFEGQEVEVTVTTGPKKLPYPNLPISFRRYHDYSWKENGKEQRGSGSHDWWANTDESGKVTVRTLPGELKASIYTPLWKTEKKLKIVKGKPAKIEFHRDVEGKRTVTGQLVLDKDVKADLTGAEVHIGSIDGKYDDEQTVKCKLDGTFSCEILASRIGIIARTADGLAVGASAVNSLNLALELKMKGTYHFDGQLRGEANQPLVEKMVRAYVTVDGSRQLDAHGATSFSRPVAETKTDAKGNFTLTGIPTNRKVELRAFEISSSRDDRDRQLGDIYLEPNDSRPRAICKLGKRDTDSTEPASLAGKFQKTLRDSRLSGYRMMLIVSDDDEKVDKFVENNFMNRGVNQDVYSFMQLHASGGKKEFDPDDAKFLKDHGWQVPSKDRVTAYVIDSSGKELGHLEIDPKHADAAKKAADFIRVHAPPAVDAEAKWNEAFAKAKRSNRRVWVRVSQRYCGPCFELTRWLDDQRELLEKDYVMLKIDDAHDTNGEKIAERVTCGKNDGIPFCAIFDADEKLLIDSVSLLGNIGNPGGIESLRHLRKMLQMTRQKLSDMEIDRIIESRSE